MSCKVTMRFFSVVIVTWEHFGSSCNRPPPLLLGLCQAVRGGWIPFVSDDGQIIMIHCPCGPNRLSLCLSTHAAREKRRNRTRGLPSAWTPWDQRGVREEDVVTLELGEVTA